MYILGILAGLHILSILIKVVSFKTIRPRKMASILQMAFSNTVFLMQMFEFWLRFHLRLFFQLTISQYWSDNGGLTPNRRQTILWTNDGLVNWLRYALIRLAKFKGEHAVVFQLPSLEWRHENVMVTHIIITMSSRIFVYPFLQSSNKGNFWVTFYWSFVWGESFGNLWSPL